MMSKRFAGVLLLIFGFFTLSNAYAGVTVTTDGDLPQPVIGTAACLSPQGELQTVGGYTGQRSLSAIYIRHGGIWSAAAHLPAPTHDAAAGYLDGELFIFGGGQAYSTRDLLRVQGTHTVRVAYLGHPLSDAVARPYRWHGTNGLIMVGGHGGPPVRKVYFISGHAGHTRWHTLFSLPVGVRYAAVAVEGSTVYIAGGLASNGRVDTAWAWQPGDAAPKPLPNLPHVLEKAAAFAWHGTVYVIGGLDGRGHPGAEILAYRVGQSGWRIVGHLPEPLADMGYVQDGHVAYLLGGMTGVSSRSADKRVWRLRFD